MERKIGEVFEYNGEWYQCVGSDMYDYCKGCASFKNLTCTSHYGNRDCWLKANCKKLEKVGEPFISGGKLYQHYKVFDIDNIDFNKCTNMNVHNYNKKTLTVEIKQNQEDMEEKKLNLKPFDIQKAREGKPVCTRDGRKARIICFDANDERSIIALLEFKCDNGCYVEKIETYYKDGKVHKESEWSNDLMMLPEKKEGWVNVYKERIYSTKEEAIEATYDGLTYVDTVKVCWEE